MRETFWVLALAVIGLFTFLVALGAFSPTDAIWATIVVGLLCVMWVMHAVLEGRHRDAPRPGRRASARAPGVLAGTLVGAARVRLVGCNPCSTPRSSRSST